VSDPADISSGQSAAAGVSAKLAELRSDRPEVLVGAAFVGGVIIAMFLKRLGSR
jgi:hypothetical protein